MVSVCLLELQKCQNNVRSTEWFNHARSTEPIPVKFCATLPICALPIGSVIGLFLFRYTSPIQDGSIKSKISRWQNNNASGHLIPPHLLQANIQYDVQRR